MKEVKDKDVRERGERGRSCGEKREKGRAVGRSELVQSEATEWMDE